MSELDYRRASRTKCVGGVLYKSAVSVLVLVLGLNLTASVNASLGVPTSQNSRPPQQAQKPDPVPDSPSPQAAQPTLPAHSAKPELTDGTPVHLRFVREVDSSHVLAGETVPLEVIEPVRAGNLVAISQLNPAEAIVTMAKARSGAGRGGTLELKIEAIRLADGELVPVRGVQVATGRGHHALYLTGATVGMVATPLVFLMYVKGKTAKIPAGTEFAAYIVGDHALDPSKFQVVGAGPQEKSGPK